MKTPDEIKKGLAEAPHVKYVVDDQSRDDVHYERYGVAIGYILRDQIYSYITQLESRLAGACGVCAYNFTGDKSCLAHIKQLESRLAQVERERDAAVADLSVIKFCHTCKEGEKKPSKNRTSATAASTRTTGNGAEFVPKTQRRTPPMNRPDKDSYFFNIAEVVASRSTCLRRQYGAVIVKDGVIKSTGYNGSPRHAANCSDVGECWRMAHNIPHGERYEMCQAVHAEANAIINAAPADRVGATLYLVGLENGKRIDAKPCLQCERLIRNAQIRRVEC